MSFTLRCRCGEALELSEAHRGQLVHCPRCKGSVKVPPVDEAAPKNPDSFPARSLPPVSVGATSASEALEPRHVERVPGGPEGEGKNLWQCLSGWMIRWSNTCWRIRSSSSALLQRRSS